LKNNWGRKKRADLSFGGRVPAVDSGGIKEKIGNDLVLSVEGGHKGNRALSEYGSRDYQPWIA